MMKETGEAYAGKEKMRIGGSQLKGCHWERNEACPFGPQNLDDGNEADFLLP